MMVVPSEGLKQVHEAGTLTQWVYFVIRVVGPLSNGVGFIAKFGTVFEVPSTLSVESFELENQADEVALKSVGWHCDARRRAALRARVLRFFGHNPPI